MYVKITTTKIGYIVVKIAYVKKLQVQSLLNSNTKASTKIILS